MADPLGVDPQGKPRTANRLLWFVALWGGSVAVVGAVSWLLRRWLLG